MPLVFAAAGAALGGMVAASAGVIAVMGVSGAMFAGAMVSLAVNYLGAKVLGTGKTGGLASAAAGTLINTAGTIDPIPVIYGQRRIGGTRVLCEVSGTTGEYLHIVTAHCEGEISAIDQIYLDGVEINDTKFSGLVTEERYTGSDAQTASAALIAALPVTLTGTYGRSGTAVTVTSTAHKRTAGEIVVIDFTSGGALDGTYTVVSVPTVDTFTVTTAASGTIAAGNTLSITANKWTLNHKLSGVAYTYVRLKYDTDVFHGLPTITVDVSGRKVSTPAAPTTYSFSANPALCIRDYLLNARFGRGIASADLDEASFTAAAAVCDEIVTTSGANAPRYTCNGLVNTDDAALDNLQKLLTCCRGFLIFTGGKYRLLVDQATVSTFAFTEDNIVGAWSIKGGDKRGRFNRIRATWINPDKEWQPEITVTDSSTYRTNDNGLMLENQTDLPFTTNIYEAKRLSEIALAQSRFGVVCSFRATIAGMLCEVGDVVTITHSTPGWTLKPFRITRIAMLNSDEVEVVAAEYDISVYTLAALTAPRVSPATNLPTISFSLAAPTSLTLATGRQYAVTAADGSVETRISATWPAVANVRVAGYEIQYKKTADSTWKSIATSSSVLAASIGPVDNGVGYDVRVRATTDGTPGIWSTTSSITAIGGDLYIQSAAPITLTGATYTRTGTTVTVTKTAHGRTAGETVYLDFTSGGALDGFYTIATSATNTFTVATAASGTITTSNCTIYAGERMEIKTNYIQVIDAFGTVRVKFGDLS